MSASKYCFNSEENNIKKRILNVRKEIEQIVKKRLNKNIKYDDFLDCFI